MGKRRKHNKGYACDWITPRELTRALGVFDLDPCASVQQPWRHARRQFTIKTDGLWREWRGRVWLNPPYDNVAEWLFKLARHGRGTALVFARTDTRWFYDFVWLEATAVLFMLGRVRFYRPDGTQASTSGGAASVLIAYGRDDAMKLQAAGIAGKFIRLRAGH